MIVATTLTTTLSNLEDFTTIVVVTLALGLRPRQGLARVQAKREAWESHFMLSGVQKIVRE
jgi:hypothetical protein